MLKLNKSIGVFVIIFSFTLFLFYVARLYLNLSTQEDYELLTFIPLLFALCFGIIFGLQYKWSSLIFNFNILFTGILVFIILMISLFFVADLRLGQFEIVNSISGGIFSGFEMTFVFFIGYISGAVSKQLSKLI